MKIEIFTKSLPYENGFVLYRTEFLDGNKFDTVKEFETTNSQLQADLLNVGLSLKYIIDFDKKFGVIITQGYQTRQTDKDYKQIQTKEKYRIYKESKERCDAIIYTENIELFENFYYSQRFYDNSLIRKMFARIIELQKESLIKIRLPEKVIIQWQDRKR